jgi:V/A-type H+-transporting ATPase subunit E
MEDLKSQLDFLKEVEVKEIIEEAKQSATRLISEARARAEEIGKREANDILKKTRETETKELEAATVQERKKVMNLKFQLIETVLASSFDRMKQLINEGAAVYKNSLEKFVIEAASRMTGWEFELIVSSRDIELVKKKLRRIEKELSSMKNAIVTLKISDEPLRSIGGVVVRSSDGKQIFNNTLEARLAKVRQEKLPEISRILFEGGKP